MPNMQFAVAMRALTVMVQGLDILIATKHTIQTKTRQAASTLDGIDSQVSIVLTVHQAVGDQHICALT